MCPPISLGGESHKNETGCYRIKHQPGGHVTLKNECKASNNYGYFLNDKILKISGSGKKGSLSDKHFVNTGQHVGVDTVG